MNPARQLAQLAGGLSQFADGVVHELPSVLRIGLDRLTREPQVERERNQALLGAVVQITLEAAAFSIARAHDPGA